MQFAPFLSFLVALGCMARPGPADEHDPHVVQRISVRAYHPHDASQPSSSGPVATLYASPTNENEGQEDRTELDDSLFVRFTKDFFFSRHFVKTYLDHGPRLETTPSRLQHILRC